MYVLDPIYKVNLSTYLKVLQYGFLGEDWNTHISCNGCNDRN